jgi:hypothetical protein
MDLVTFYMLYAIGTGPAKVGYPLRFPSMSECEWMATQVRERRKAEFHLFDSACVADGTHPPEWVAKRPTVGVPLMLDARPPG